MKVLLLGIDALDCLLLDRFADRLPNFAALRASAAQLRVHSTFPPDSDTAWATIMTGLNPAEHGIVRFVDPLEKSYQILNFASPNDVLRGRTFWDIAGRAGLRAHAIFPHLCYPIWDTPGIMVARGAVAVDVQAMPAGILQDYPDRPILCGVRGLPDRGLSGLRAYARDLRRLALADAEFALRLMRQHEWDLFFVYWSTLDAIGHFFWGYFDADDPGYVRGHSLHDVLEETYRLYDELVGRFLEAIGDEVAVMLLSDHGQGGRPHRLVNVNEILRQAGLLRACDLSRRPHLGLLESGKRAAVRSVSRYGLGRWAARLMRRFPGAVQTFTRPASVDWERTMAYATDLSGIKAYPYGGIHINRGALNGCDYERVRSDIIDLVPAACALPDGTRLLRFIARREDLYQGPHIGKYPDLVLEFNRGYGLGWAVRTPLITPAAAHALVPGSHRGDTGTCLLRCRRPATGDEIDLRDVTPTLLDLLGIQHDGRLEGRSVLAGQTG